MATATAARQHPRTKRSQDAEFAGITLQPYLSRGRSGVTNFASGPEFIILQFKTGERYLYSHQIPGRSHVQMMKQLAREGHGLATYINQHVRGNYAQKLEDSSR